MIDLTFEATRRSLRKAMDNSSKILEEFMERRRDLILKTIGDNWGVGEKKTTVTNLLFRAFDTFSSDLSINRPVAYIAARNQQQAWFAANFNVAVNSYAKSIYFGNELASGIADALFGMGVFKRYWAPTDEFVEIMDPDLEEPGEEATPQQWADYTARQFIKVDPGQPMIERICPEDFVYDTAQSRRRYFRFEAHKYRRSLASVRADRRFNPDVRMKVKQSSKYGENEQERAQRLSELGNFHDVDELEPMVTLWDVYLPQEKQFAVLSDDASLEPLMVEPWNGAPGGPFSILVFGQVPDNFAPISLLGNLESIHDILNSIFRKTTRQVARQKEFTTFAGPEADAQRTKDCKDGDVIRVSAPEAIQQNKTGGVNPLTMQYAATMQQLGNREGGNLDLIAGIAPQSRTATQDQLLNKASGEMQAKRMQRVAEVTGELYEALAWMMWHDVTLEVPGQRMIPELNMQVDATWRPDERLGDIDDYQFSYIPYNDSYQSPTERMSAVNTLLMKVYIPLYPLLQASGQTIDLSELAKFHSEMGNLPEITRFIKPLPPQQMQPGMGGGGQGQQEDQLDLPTAERTYDHTYQGVNEQADTEPGAEWQAMAGAQ